MTDIRIRTLRQEVPMKAEGIDLSRRLAELLEPEPGIVQRDRLLSAGGWWEWNPDVLKWGPIDFGDAALRRVREELKRRGLLDDYLRELYRITQRDEDCLPIHAWQRLVQAEVDKQIAAAVAVLEEAKNDKG